MVVFDDAAVADFSVAWGQPGDRAFHHGAVLAVLDLSRQIASLGAGSSLQGFIFGQGEFASALGGGALWRQRACAAALPETDTAAMRDQQSMAGGAGHGAGIEIDGEVVAGETPGTGARNGTGLITATCSAWASAARVAPVP